MTLSRLSAQLTVGALVIAGVALGTASAGAAVDTDPADGVPRIGTPVDYDAYPAIADPGSGSAEYFQPFWYETQGRHIQAHGGQIVTVQEAGQSVYYWYGEDRTHGYYDSPGVSVYRSTDTRNWENMGTALRGVSDDAELIEDPYFTELYDTLDDSGQPRTERAQSLAYFLNSSQTSTAYSAIFERPKVLYNARNDQWVMWWHADGKTVAGGSNYARSMAAVAVSDSPTGPFRLTGAYRMPNRAGYQGCTSAAVPGQARDMTLFQDEDGTAYIVYSSEENRSLYIARLDADYTNVEHTTTTDAVATGVRGGTAPYLFQYSDDGRYPYIFADGSADAPVRGEDFQIVKECGMLEAPAVFTHGGRYYTVASGATGWAPNQQTYHSATDILGTWIRGVQADDAYENVAYNAIPEGGDGLLSWGDDRRTTFGSQSTDVLTLAPGKYVYLGDRWNSGESDSTYVWLPITVGEGGALEMRNPSASDPARWSDGWDDTYWDDQGLGSKIWSVDDGQIPEAVRRGSAGLPGELAITVDGASAPVAAEWSGALDGIGAQKVTARLAADADFTEGRRISRTVDVWDYGVANIAPSSTVTASSRADLAPRVIDRDVAAKGWDDWVSGGAYPRDSWLAFTWPTAQRADEIVVHTYRDGPSGTWPSSIRAQYRDASGAWIDTDVSATVSQSADAAPVATLDTSGLPATTGIRLLLHTDTATWQAISEVQIWGQPTAQGNMCRLPGSVVSASFHQTEWDTLPAANACDGSVSTAWSTWAGGDTSPGTASFTITPATAYRVSQATFTNVEGTIRSVSVAYRGIDGLWHETTVHDAAVEANGVATTVSFDAVTATAVRLDFATPGSYLKISELAVDGTLAQAPDAAPAVTATATVRCVAGKAQTVVTATNTGADAADAVITTPWGTRTIVDIGAERSRSVAFATRAASVAAGTLSVASADRSSVIGYPAVDCG